MAGEHRGAGALVAGSGGRVEHADLAVGFPVLHRLRAVFVLIDVSRWWAMFVPSLGIGLRTYVALAMVAHAVYRVRRPSLPARGTMAVWLVLAMAVALIEPREVKHVLLGLRYADGWLTGTAALLAYSRGAPAAALLTGGALAAGAIQGVVAGFGPAEIVGTCIRSTWWVATGAGAVLLMRRFVSDLAEAERRRAWARAEAAHFHTLHTGIVGALEALARRRGEPATALAQLRGLLDALSEATPPAPGLQSALQDCLDVVEGDMRGAFRARGTPSAIPGDVEEVLVAVAQEAVTNAVKHSRGTRVQVELNGGPGWAEVCVTDDGVGMATAVKGYGLGTSLPERVRAVDGGLHLRSSEGEGTSVLMRWPRRGRALPERAGASALDVAQSRVPLAAIAGWNVVGGVFMLCIGWLTYRPPGWALFIVSPAIAAAATALLVARPPRRATHLRVLALAWVAGCWTAALIHAALLPPAVALLPNIDPVAPMVNGALTMLTFVFGLRAGVLGWTLYGLLLAGPVTWLARFPGFPAGEWIPRMAFSAVGVMLAAGAGAAMGELARRRRAEHTQRARARYYAEVASDLVPAVVRVHEAEERGELATAAATAALQARRVLDPGGPLPRHPAVDTLWPVLITHPACRRGVEAMGPLPVVEDRQLAGVVTGVTALLDALPPGESHPSLSTDAHGGGLRLSLTRREGTGPPQHVVERVGAAAPPGVALAVRRFASGFQVLFTTGAATVRPEAMDVRPGASSPV